MSETDYVARISQLDRDGLLSLWEQIARRDTPGWPDGKAFEYLVLRSLELDGARIVWPYSVYFDGQLTEQIDGAVYAAALSCLVESKCYRDALNVEPIAKLRNQLARRPASTVGAIFSHSGFTMPALTLAQHLAPQTVVLWTGDEVQYALEHGEMVLGLRLKYERAVERGLPDYSLFEALT